MSDEEYIGRCYVRYPPNDPRTLDELRREIVGTSEDEVSSRDQFALDMALMMADSANPAQKAQAVRDLHAERVYPPTAVMAWLAEGFGRWVDAGGDVSLETCLGLRRPDMKSAANRLAALNRENRRMDLAYAVRRLRRVFGLSRPQAAGMVAAKIADDTEPLAETTLEQFEKALPPTPEYDDILSQVTDDARLRLLSRYPPHSYRHLIPKSRILRRIVKKSGTE